MTDHASPLRRVAPFALAALFTLGACGSNAPAPMASETASATDAAAAAAPAAAAAAVFPASLVTVGDGYPAKGDACRQLGESAATSTWLDASARLVGCPSAEAAAALGGKIVGSVDGITVVSIPMAKENQGMGEAPAASSAATVAGKDPIRSKGGLEDKCKAAVAKQGTKVIGTNRIEESQAAVEIFINVEGGKAPWRCLIQRNGTVSAVEYTGSEGAL